MAYSATNFHSEHGVIFANKVKDYTNGKLEITVHPGGSLFKGGEIIDLLVLIEKKIPGIVQKEFL